MQRYKKNTIVNYASSSLYYLTLGTNIKRPCKDGSRFAGGGTFHRKELLIRLCNKRKHTFGINDSAKCI